MTKEEEKAYKKQWYIKNKEAVVKRAKANNSLYIKRNKEYVNNIKEKNPCKDCNSWYPHYVMDFDHLSDKIDAIANMMKNAISLEKIKKEIAKCDLLCSNCHRTRTWKRRQIKAG